MANNNEPLINKQINFTLNVSANDLDPDDKNFKVKAVLDFVPAFSNGPNSGLSTFNANKVHALLTFISDRVIKKVVEQVYFDRENEKYVPETKLPPNYKKVIGIYDERRKKKQGDDDYSHLDLYERKPANGDTNCIECIVDDFFKNPERPVWEEETNVTRIIFEQQSPPTLTVESRTIVNGDKRPK